MRNVCLENVSGFDANFLYYRIIIKKYTFQRRAYVFCLTFLQYIFSGTHSWWSMYYLHASMRTYMCEYDSKLCIIIILWKLELEFSFDYVDLISLICRTYAKSNSGKWWKLFVKVLNSARRRFKMWKMNNEMKRWSKTHRNGESRRAREMERWFFHWQIKSISSFKLSTSKYLKP